MKKTMPIVDLTPYNVIIHNVMIDNDESTLREELCIIESTKGCDGEVLIRVVTLPHLERKEYKSTEMEVVAEYPCIDDVITRLSHREWKK